MNIPNEEAMDAISDCFCKTFRAEKGSIGCLDCPLHKIKIEYGACICSLYLGNDAERMKLLQACIEHGNAQMFKDLPSEYRRFVIRKALVV